MKRSLLLLVLLLAAALPAHAQDPGWRPSSTSMPAMPRMTELQGGWQNSVGPWLQEITRFSGVPAGEVRALGETTGGSDQARFVRFAQGYFTLGTWNDRNGDGRCDMIELYRDKVLRVQLIDANQDGRIDVVRYHDASGKFIREDPLSRR